MISSVGDGALDVPKTSLQNPSNPRSISNVYRRGGGISPQERCHEGDREEPSPAEECSSHNLSAKSLFPAQHIHLTVGTTIGRPFRSILHQGSRTVNDRPYEKRMIEFVGTLDRIRRDVGYICRGGPCVLPQNDGR